jgi:5-methylcytosine-specific restriction endonuclease McrA
VDHSGVGSGYFYDSRLEDYEVRKSQQTPDKTPREIIRNAIRRYVWLTSRERSSALKRDGHTCQGCGKKASAAKGKEFKVEVHHKSGESGIDAVVEYIYRQLLVSPEHLETLCHECHRREHGKGVS